MLVHIKEIVKNAEKGGYCVGAFNVHGLESILGVANAAVRAKSPAIIQVSEGAVKYMGLEAFVAIVTAVAKTSATKVPLSFHLDHGKDINIVMACIKAGFSSVHMDGSHLPLKENIAITKKIVNIAHKKNVWVQGEVGAIMGGHGSIGGKLDGIQIAKLEEVIEFVQKTGVDTIAAAVGTAHGVYDNEDIIVPLLKDIKKQTKKTFVLHGGSGLPSDKIKKAIKAGTNIINIGSDIKIAFADTLKKTCLANKTETDPRKLMSPSIVAIEEVTMGHMKIFGSAGRVK